MLPVSCAGPCKLLSGSLFTFCQPSPEPQRISGNHGQLTTPPHLTAISHKDFWLPLQVVVPDAAAAPQRGLVRSHWLLKGKCMSSDGW